MTPAMPTRSTGGYIDHRAALDLLLSLTLSTSGDANQAKIGGDVLKHYQSYLDRLFVQDSFARYGFEVLSCVYAHLRSMAIARGTFVLRRAHSYRLRDLRIKYYEGLSGLSSLSYEGAISRVTPALFGGIGGAAAVKGFFEPGTWYVLFLIAVPIAGLFYFAADVALRRFALRQMARCTLETEEMIPDLWYAEAVPQYVSVLQSYLKRLRDIEGRYPHLGDDSHSRVEDDLALVHSALVQLNPALVREDEPPASVGKLTS